MRADVRLPFVRTRAGVLPPVLVYGPASTPLSPGTTEKQSHEDKVVPGTHTRSGGPPSRARSNDRRRFLRACASLYGLTPLEREPVHAPGASARNVPLPCGNPVWQAAFMTARAADRARYDRATAHLDAPLAIVDLDAFDANADDLVRRAGGKPVRVASKSVRCRALLERVLARDGFAGLMSFTLAESLWLARSGFEDVLLAYPSADHAAFGELANDPKLAAAVTVMIDDPAQLKLIDDSRDGGTEVIRVCLELDTSLRMLGGRIRVGALRSPSAPPPNSPTSQGRCPAAPASRSSGSWPTKVTSPASVTPSPGGRSAPARSG